MDLTLWEKRNRLAKEACSPSPCPLPLGEGMRLAAIKHMKAYGWSGLEKGFDKAQWAIKADAPGEIPDWGGSPDGSGDIAGLRMMTFGKFA